MFGVHRYPSHEEDHLKSYQISNHEQILETIENSGIPADKRLLIGSAALSLAGAESNLFTMNAHDVDLLVPVSELQQYYHEGQTPSGIAVKPNKFHEPRFLSTVQPEEAENSGQTDLKIDLIPWFDNENHHQSFEDYYQNDARFYFGVATVSLAKSAEYRRKHKHYNFYMHREKEAYAMKCISLYKKVYPDKI